MLKDTLRDSRIKCRSKIVDVDPIELLEIFYKSVVSVTSPSSEPGKVGDIPDVVSPFVESVTHPASTLGHESKLIADLAYGTV